MNEKLFTVGKIVNTHGIRGELKVISQTDFPEVRYKKGSVLLIQDPLSRRTVSVTVESARPHKNTYLLKFAGLDSINDVEKYKGCLLKVRERDLQELDEGEFYYHEIIGCKVVTDDGEELGTIREILAPGANDVWVVERGKGKPVLIPYIDDVVLHVDVADKRVTVRLPEGLVDE